MITVAKLTSDSETAITINFKCVDCRGHHSFNIRENDDTSFVTRMNEMVTEHAKCDSRLTEET